MTRTVVGIFHNPWRAAYRPKESTLELYRRAVWLKANPRSEHYMKELFLERYAQGRFVNADADPTWRNALDSADTVVLLYPDATGLYFRRIETVIERHKNTWATVRVLNGRRRDFVWSARVRRALRWRRFLERAMVGEMLAIGLFLATTPFLVVSDVTRRRW